MYKTLRQATGAGMMDAKKALEDNDGDFEAAAKWLRERGLGKAAERTDRENAEGAVAVATRPADAAALVQLKCETDFVAKSPQFVELLNELAQLVADKGEDAVAEPAGRASTTSRSPSRRTSSSAGSSASRPRPATSSTPTCTCRTAAASTASSSSSPAASQELAHDIAVHIAFGKPSVLTRDEVPAADVEAEREALDQPDPQRGQARGGAARRSSRASSTAGTSGSRAGCCSTSPTPRTTSRPCSRSSAAPRIVRFAQVVVGG